MGVQEQVSCQQFENCYISTYLTSRSYISLYPCLCLLQVWFINSIQTLLFLLKKNRDSSYSSLFIVWLLALLKRYKGPWNNFPWTCFYLFTTFTDIYLNLYKDLTPLSLLQVHQKQRTACPVCGKRYSDLRQHIRLVHEGRKVSWRGHFHAIFIYSAILLLQHECPTCKKKFTNLSQHINKTHKRLRAAQCDKCGKTFYLESQLRRHVEDVHSYWGEIYIRYRTYRLWSLLNLSSHNTWMIMIRH